MKQIYLLEPDLIGRHKYVACEVVEVSDKRAQQIVKCGKGEEYTGDVDQHFNNWLRHEGYNQSDIDDAIETATLKVEYETAVLPKPKRKRRRKKSEA